LKNALKLLDYHMWRKTKRKIGMNTYLKTYLTGDGISLFIRKKTSLLPKTENDRSKHYVINPESNPVFTRIVQKQVTSPKTHFQIFLIYRIKL
jgi:hypothetical protein